MSVHKVPSPLATVLAASTGLATLVLEILWIRMLAIETGGPLKAFILVVTCFMLGTAVGASALGALADKVRHPLRLFGLSQLGVAVFGVVTLVAAGSGGLSRPLLIYFDLAPGDLWFNTVLILTNGAVSAVAAFLAGGSLPLLVKSVDSTAPLARRAGTLASFQAFGGAAGAVLCGFVLLPFAGLRLSMLGVSGLTMLTGLAALGWRRSIRRATPGVTMPAQAHEQLSARIRMVSLVALTASGMALMILEVGWTRLTALSFGSSAQAGSLILALVIAGLAVGYAGGARAATRTDRPVRLFTGLLAASGVSLLIGDVVFGRLPVLVTWTDRWFETEAGASNWRLSLARCAVLLLPVGIPCILLGAVYPLVLRLWSARTSANTHDGRDTGLASSLSAFGNMAGPPLAYFWIIGALGARGCLLVPAFGLCLSAMMVAAADQTRQPRPTAAVLRLVLPFALVGVSAAWLPWDPVISSSGPYLYASYYRSAMEESSSGLAAAVRQRGDLIYSHEGPEALVTVRRSAGGLLSLQVNGKTDASTGGDLKTQALTAHLPLFARAGEAGGTAHVLVVGLGSGVTAAAALAHPETLVDVIEISPGVVAASSLFRATTGDLDANPRMRLIHGDARTHLLFAEGQTRYDVIASQPSNPWIEGQAILFTREFFELALSRLTPGGVMCQWLQGQGLPAEDFRSILATFQDVFPNASLWEESTAGGDYLLLGSAAPLVFDETRLRTTMSEPSVARDLARIEMAGPADLLAHHVVSGEELKILTRGAVIQTQDRLSLEFTAPRALHRETLGEILTLLEPVRSGGGKMIHGSTELAGELARRQSSARNEREWAAGLGLLAPSRQLDPDLLRAASYLRAGMRAHALETVRSLALKNPSRRTPHLMTAHLLMSAPGGPDHHDLEEVVHELKIAVTLDPSEPRARLFLSRALRAAGSLQEALVENTAIPPPRPPVADSDRCAMFLESGDGASAEAACLEALTRDPMLAAAHANLGVVRSRRGRNGEAAASYRKALELDPGLLDTRYNLAALYGRLDRPRDGLEILNSLVSPPAPGADSAMFILAARLALAAGDPGAARTYLRESLARQPATAETEEIARRISLGTGS